MPEWSKTLAGPDVRHWSTVRNRRRVLVLIHTVASANRLADVLPVFDSDPRVQLVFTCPEASAVSYGVAELATRLGWPTIPWRQARHTHFDLAISANHSGDLHELDAPLVVLSHGIGYTKTINGKRKTENGKRKTVYGLSAESLLHSGAVVADRIVLSHPEQLDRLARAVPEAASAAVLAGDPCYDRLRTSLPLRNQYRGALGADNGTTVVLVSSTWRDRSLFGTDPGLVRRLLGELPLDSFLVVAVLHPHIWHGHGGGEIHSWLADCRRAGLRLVPPTEGWQAALVAADFVLGDHGSVTCYAAALDIPLALAAFPADAVADGSPVALLGQSAPRLDPRGSLRAQLERITGEYSRGRYSGVAELITSLPDGSAGRLKSLFYELMDLPEPPGEAPVAPLPVDSLAASGAAVRACFVSGSVDPAGHAGLRRVPADVLHGRPTPEVVPENAHLVAEFHHPLRGLRGNADIVFCHAEELTTSWTQWAGDILEHHPGATLAAVVTRHGECLIAGRERQPRRVSPLPDAGGHGDPLLWASTVYLWLTEAQGTREIPATLTVTAGARTWSARVEAA